jgi:hypothetical protein
VIGYFEDKVKDDRKSVRNRNMDLDIKILETLRNYNEENQV